MNEASGEISEGACSVETAGHAVDSSFGLQGEIDRPFCFGITVAMLNPLRSMSEKVEAGLVVSAVQGVGLHGIVVDLLEQRKEQSASFFVAPRRNVRQCSIEMTRRLGATSIGSSTQEFDS
jgi:hypothetical protein